MVPHARGSDADGRAHRLTPSGLLLGLLLAAAVAGTPAAARADAPASRSAGAPASPANDDGGGPEPVPLGPCGPIGRTHEAIELRGMRLRRMAGVPIARLGLVAWRGGIAHPIPFQVDERIGSRLAMPDGPEPQPDDQPGVLDPDDAFLFMACDAGDRAPDGTPPKAAGREIRIVDPRTGATAWAYVVIADVPPRTDRRYVAYDAAHDLVRTAHWRVGCVGALPEYFAVNTDGVLGPNLVDGLRLRADAVLRANLAHWTLTERDGRHALVAWKAGPIRVVRRSRHQVEIGLGIHLTAGLAHTAFYAEHVLAPGSMRLPFSPSVFFRDITAVGGIDLRHLEGWRYLAPATPAGGFAVDGRMDAAERAYDGRGRWFALVHGPDAVLVAITMSPNLEQALPLDLVYVDDAGRAAPPEKEPGSVPFVGVRARHVERLDDGRYQFQLRILLLQRWQAGAQDEALAAIASPLQADVTMPPDLQAVPPGRRH